MQTQIRYKAMINTIYSIISLLGISKLFHFFTRNKVTIISYHNPNVEILEQHLKYLSKKYHFISMDYLVDALYKKDFLSMPKNAMVITFDDGHKKNSDSFYVFEKYNLKPTIYCCSNIVGTKHVYWWNSLNNKTDSLLYKKMSNKDRLKTLKDENNYSTDYESTSVQSLSLEDLKYFKNIGVIGSHTRNHPILTQCTKEELLDEIQGSKNELEQKINTNISHFAYPNGDYNEEIVDIVKNAGYLSARTTDAGWTSLKSNPYKLKVIGISDDADIMKLKFQLTGIPLWIQYLKKGSLNGIKK